MNDVRIRSHFDDKITKKVTGLRGEFDKLGKNKGAQSVLQGVGIGAGIGAYSLLTGAVSTAGEALASTINAASDLRESISLTDSVFKGNSAEMQAWAANAGNAFGQSQREALDFAANFGNAFTNVGFALDESSDKAKEMTRLAADLGSAFNAGADEAALALRSGLLGESEPLRRFGVFLNETKVAAKAVELGIAKMGDKLTDAQKVTARYAIIMESTAASQGMFGRDSSSLADAQKRLGASTENLAASIGTGLVPVLADLVTNVNQAVVGMGDLGAATDDVLQPVGGLGAVWDTLLAGLTSGTSTLLENANALKKEADAARTAGDLVGGKLKDDLGLAATAMDTTGDAADRMAGVIRVNTVSAVDSAQMIEDAWVDTANDMISRAFDPISAKYELVATNAEVSAARRAAATKGATSAEKLALNESLEEQARGILAMAEAGMQSSAVYKSAMASLKRAAKEATGSTKVYLNDVIRSIENVRSHGKSVPINIIATTSLRGGYLGGARAGGGPVKADTAYLVGEEGPELFVPSSGGAIVPNGGTGGRAGGVGGGSTIVHTTVKLDGKVIAEIVDKHLHSMLQRAAPTMGRT